MDAMVAKALKAKRESKHIEFKEYFEPSIAQDWCEVVKDICAIANSGGGIILFGVQNNGEPSARNIRQVLELDSATIIDKVFRYTGVQFSDFELFEESKDGHIIAVLRVSSINVPMVFISPGTYAVLGGKQQTAFARGTIYFRHGAKSEPANRDDLRLVIERNLEEVRKNWIKGVRKVIKAPIGSQVHVLPREVVPSDSPNATPIRLVDDPSVPAYYKLSPDVIHIARKM